MTNYDTADDNNTPIISIGREEVVLDSSNTKSATIAGGKKKSHGFHLVRSKWDPYPWIESVESDSSADISGLRPGDCLLEIDGRDVIGHEMRDIARLIGNGERVSLSVWRRPAKGRSSNDARTSSAIDNDLSATIKDSSVQNNDNNNTLLDAPLPEVARKLVRAVTGLVRALECPVCLDSAAPPVSQCVHGHILCFGCRLKTSRCPVCRVRLGQGRCLLADKSHRALADALIDAPFNGFKNDGDEPGIESDAKPRSLRDSIFGKSSSKSSVTRTRRLNNKSSSPVVKQLFSKVMQSAAKNRCSAYGNDYDDEYDDDLNDRRNGSTESLPSCAMDANLLYGRRWLLRLYDRRKSASTGELSKTSDDRDVNDRIVVAAGGGSNNNVDTSGINKTRRMRRFVDLCGRMRGRRGCTDDEDDDATISDNSGSFLSVPQTPTWGGSTESVTSNAPNASNNKFRCPLINCGTTGIVDGNAVLEHLREIHINGPQVHFYRKPITTRLPWPLPFFQDNRETVYIFHQDDDEVFVVMQNDKKHIWMCNLETSRNNINNTWEWILRGINDDGLNFQMSREVISLREPFELNDARHVLDLSDRFAPKFVDISLVELNSASVRV